MRVLKFATQYECFQIFKVPLLNSCFRKHTEKFTKKMVNGSNFDTKFGSDSQCL